jgi:hypothetical protein
MWITLAAILLGAWFLGFVVLKVSRFAIHFLMLAALVAIAIHFAARLR